MGKTVDETDCSGPKLLAAEFKMSTALYACGKNADTANADTCQVSECNKPVADNVAWKCPAYKWATDKFEKEAAEKDVACLAVKDTEKKCKSPGAKAVAATTFGCGPCAEAAVKDETCVTMNSAAKLTVFLLPMIALFYTLF